MKPSITGWDIGGAHLKVAVLDWQGRVLQVRQQPCPLWKGLHELEQALRQVQVHTQDKTAYHVLTMTGELVDLFKDRAQGVRAIIDLMRRYLSDDTKIQVFAVPGVFLSVQEPLTLEQCERIASANWLASACYAAHHIRDGLFMDIGSTTTDIIAIAEHKPEVQGWTDYQRLCRDELVYTGIVRTPVMAIAERVSFEGQPVALMAEYFATMADVYRLTCELDERHDQGDSADGAEKTPEASARRLARMIGCDFRSGELSRWQQFARSLRRCQLEKLESACRKQQSQPALLVGAGVGRFLVRQLAERLGSDYQDFDTLLTVEKKSLQTAVADCAPAVAVAGLALELL